MKRFLTRLLPLFATLLIAACAGKIVTSGNYTLGAGETLDGDLTMTSGNAVLETDSHVTGSILITSGNLEVNGEIDGDIVITSGDVSLGSDAYVHGDISATSGDTRQAEGARVDGQVLTDGAGMGINLIGGIIGQILIVPLLIIALLFYFVFRPAQNQQVKIKRSDEIGDSYVEEEARIPGGGMMDNQNSRVTGAIVLIGLGVVFLLAQSGLLSLSGNWWAIFIALPAAMLLYNAYTAYQRAGEMTPEVRRNLTGGVTVGTVAVIALTGQWGTLWPLFLIVPGVMMLLGSTKQSDEA